MKKTLIILFLWLFLGGIVQSVSAEAPPLIHRLPSGITLILSSVPEADAVSVQILVDKRSFKNDIAKQIYVNAYLGNIEQKLSAMDGVVRLFPLEDMPESVYDPWSEQYLNFKTTSIYFNKNIKTILKPFLGKVRLLRFPLRSRNQILKKAQLANFIVPNDSIKKIVNGIKFSAFEHFVNSVSLRQNVYLYIAGNFDLFRTVNSAVRISEILGTKETLPEKIKSDPMDWYWAFTFWRFNIEELKQILAKGDRRLPLRLFAPLTDCGQPVNVRLLRGNKAVVLSDTLKHWLSDRFDTFFMHWYRQHYFYDLKWMFDDADRKGFFRLLSTAYTGQPDALFTVRENPDPKVLRLKFNAFLKRMHFGRLPGK